MSGTQTMSAASVEETVKDFWATRPRRQQDGRKVAGVAAGIARRYAIDPVIVRVAFVVGAVFGGAGVLLYVLGWLLLPEERDEVSPFESMVNRGRSGTSTTVTVVLCLALIPLSGWFWGEFSGVIDLVIMLGLLFLLHHTRGHLNRPEVAPRATGFGGFTSGFGGFGGFGAPTGQQGTATTGTTSTTGASTVDTGTTGERTTPPEWDPLGAAPFAWDLPDPAPAPAPRPVITPRRRSVLAAVTVVLAVVTAAVCAMLSPLVGWMTVPHICGIALGVLGVGMVVAGLRGEGRGMVGLAVLVGVIGIAATSLHVPSSASVGDRSFTPTSIADVQPSYSLGAGDFHLDLTKLPSSGAVRTTIDAGLGDTTVLVPATADVHVTCDANAGHVDCLGNTGDGLNVHRTRTDDGTDGPGGLRIDLTVTKTAGDVQVRRG